MTCGDSQEGTELGPLDIDYIKIYECDLIGLELITILFLCVWIAFLIHILGNTASNYLSPTLALLCEQLNISYNVAGVTFLAFGNGAPDVFSLIASFTHKNVDSHIGVGALLGAGVFVTTIVVGTITILSPCYVNRDIFLRDCSFYLIAVTIVIILGAIRDITLFSALGLFVVYASYVIGVVNGWLGKTEMNSNGETESNRSNSSVQAAFWHPYAAPQISLGLGSNFEMTEVREAPLGLNHKDEHTDAKKKPYTFLLVNHDEDDDERDIDIEGGKAKTFNGLQGHLNIMEDYFDSPITSTGDGIHNGDTGEEVDSLTTSLIDTPPYRGTSLSQTLEWHQWVIRRRFQRHILNNEWWGYSLYGKIFSCVEAPFTFARDLSIPTCDETLWFKPYAVIQPIVAMQILLFSFGVTKPSIYIFFFFLSLVPSAAMFLFTTQSKAPSSGFIGVTWTISGFLMCICWIFLVAQELVTCLTAIGYIFNIPAGVLGLTVLAWGNSIGDLLSNVSIAQQGKGEMAIAGCYGGPAFNMLIGLGLSFLTVCVKQYPDSFFFGLDASSITSLVFLLISLASAIIVVPLRDYKLDKVFGYWLIFVYIVYTISELTLLIFEEEEGVL